MDQRPPESSSPDLSSLPVSPVPGENKVWQFPNIPRKVWITLAALAVLVSAALVVIFVLKNRDDQPTFVGDAKLTIVAPNQSVSGSEVDFEIRVENVSNTKLTGLVLELFYPRGFEFLDSTPDPEPEDAAGAAAGRTYSFSDLSPGQERRLVVVGTLTGSVQEVKTLTAKLRYIPENFRSAFEATAQANVVMLPPQLALKLLGPAQSFAGQVAEYQAQVTNQSQSVFAEVAVAIHFPEDFEFLGSEPAFMSEPPPGIEADGVWVIRNVQPQDQQELRFSGRIKPTTSFPPLGGSKEVLVRAEQLLRAGDSDEFVSAGRGFLFTELLPVPLVLEQELVGRGGSVSSEFLKLGETVEYRVRYQHTGQLGLRSVRISLLFKDNIFDISGFKNLSGQGQRQGDAIHWIPPAQSDLVTVLPGSSGEFRFSVPVAATLIQETKANPVAATEVQFVSEEFTLPVSGGSLERKVITAVELQATAIKVGDSSTFRIQFSVSNSVNALQNTVLTATIPGVDAEINPASISPANETGNVRFDTAQGVLHWTLGELPAFTGTSRPARQLAFELTTNADILLQDILISGFDSFVNAEVRSEAVDLKARGF